MQARIDEVADGRALNILGNLLLEKAGSDDLGGSAAVFLQTVVPGGGPPAHVHRETDEFFFVLDGEIDVWVGERYARLTSGMSVVLPRGVVHRFDNVTKLPARALTLVTPGRGARFFEDVDRARPRLPDDMGKLAAIVARHDIELMPDS
ncbi:MAG TPA: cupin domain-containing protein [Casimicrobiaceae bacterium]